MFHHVSSFRSISGLGSFMWSGGETGEDGSRRLKPRTIEFKFTMMNSPIHRSGTRCRMSNVEWFEMVRTSMLVWRCTG